MGVQFDVHASPPLPVEEPALLFIAEDREGRAILDGELIVVAGDGPLPPCLPFAPVFIDIRDAP